MQGVENTLEMHERYRETRDRGIPSRQSARTMQGDAQPCDPSNVAPEVPDHPIRMNNLRRLNSAGGRVTLRLSSVVALRYSA